MGQQQPVPEHDEAFRPVDVATHVSHMQEYGYAIMEDVLEPHFLDALTQATDRIMRTEKAQPTNAFKGLNTIRIGDLLAKDEVFRRTVMAPPLMALNEALLGRDFLLTSLMTMAIGPGSKAQPIHNDDIYACKGFPRPFPTVQLTAVWALTDFTEENGATRLIPGTHLSSQMPAVTLNEAVDRSGQLRDDTIALTMKAGSVAIWNGAVWHGAGGNRTDAHRVGLTASYNVGWLRPYENFCLSMRPDEVRDFPARLQEMLGFGLYLGSLGTIRGEDPRKALFPGWTPPTSVSSP